MKYHYGMCPQITNANRVILGIRQRPHPLLLYISNKQSPIPTYQIDCLLGCVARLSLAVAEDGALGLL